MGIYMGVGLKVSIHRRVDQRHVCMYVYKDIGKIEV